MSDLYDLFKPKEPPAPQAFDKEAWAEKKKAEKSRCYARIDASLERIGQDPALFEGLPVSVIIPGIIVHM